MDVAPTHSEETRAWIAKDHRELDNVLHTRETTSFSQPLDVAFMGLFATLLQETAGELVESSRADTRLSAPRRHVPSQVDDAMKNLSTHGRGGRHLRVEESLRSALLQDANDSHAKRGLMGDPKAACTGSECERGGSSSNGPPQRCRATAWTSTEGNRRLQRWNFQPPTSCRYLELFYSTSFWRRLPQPSEQQQQRSRSSEEWQGHEEGQPLMADTSGFFQHTDAYSHACRHAQASSSAPIIMISRIPARSI